MITIDTLQRLERIDLYRNFASVPVSRVVAGLMYEPLAYARLQEGVELELKPMIKWGKLRMYFHWKTEGTEQTGNSVTFPANTVIIYEGTVDSHIRHTPFGAFDELPRVPHSIIVTDSCISFGLFVESPHPDTLP